MQQKFLTADPRDIEDKTKGTDEVQDNACVNAPSQNSATCVDSEPDARRQRAILSAYTLLRHYLDLGLFILHCVADVHSNDFV